MDVAKSDGVGGSSPAPLTLLVIIGGILLASPIVGASNQETTAEPSMVTFTFEGEFMFLAQMEFEVFDSDQNSVLRSGAGNHQLVLAPGQYNIEARANAGPFSVGMESLEFDSQEYSHVTLTVQYVLVAEVVSVLVLVSLALSLLKATRRSFGRLRRKRSISISSNAHVEPTDDMLAEQDPKSDGVRIHLGPPPPEEEKVLRERKSAEEESLPEQEPVDDPYYPGAPGDRELAIKYGLEWIKTPEEEKGLRELWEKENERRKKRGSILISWLVWKEMRRQDGEEYENSGDKARDNWLKTPEGKKAAEDALGHLHIHAQDREYREKERKRRDEGKNQEIREREEWRRTMIEKKKDVDDKIKELKEKLKKLRKQREEWRKSSPYERKKWPPKGVLGWMVFISGFFGSDPGEGTGLADAKEDELVEDKLKEIDKEIEELENELRLSGDAVASLSKHVEAPPPPAPDTSTEQQKPSVELHQLNLKFDGQLVPNSDWGSVILDYTVSSVTHYFNLGLNGQWSVQNIAIFSGEPPGTRERVAMNFDLGINSGTNVEAAAVSWSLTPDILASPPPGIQPLLLHSREYVINSGIAGRKIEVARAVPLIGALLCDPRESDPVAHAGFPNEDCGLNECVPVAVRNSIGWLNKTHKLGIKDEIYNMKNLKEVLRWNKRGVKDSQWYKRKDRWMKSKNVPIKTMRYRINDHKKLYAAIKDKCDVELNTKTHTVAVVGIGKTCDGKYILKVAHDTEQDGCNCRNSECKQEKKNKKCLRRDGPTGCVIETLHWDPNSGGRGLKLLTTPKKQSRLRIRGAPWTENLMDFVVECPIKGK